MTNQHNHGTQYFRDDLDLITCVVQRGRADKVAKAALEAGADGATILFGRGMGLRERLGLLGLAIVPEKEIIMIVTGKNKTPVLFDVIAKAARLDVPGMGIAYVHPISHVAGLFVSDDGPSPDSTGGQ